MSRPFSQLAVNFGFNISGIDVFTTSYIASPFVVGVTICVFSFILIYLIFSNFFIISPLVALVPIPVILFSHIVRIFDLTSHLLFLCPFNAARCPLIHLCRILPHFDAGENGYGERGYLNPVFAKKTYWRRITSFQLRFYHLNKESFCVTAKLCSIVKKRVLGNYRAATEKEWIKTASAVGAWTAAGGAHRGKQSRFFDIYGSRIPGKAFCQRSEGV